MTNDEHSNSGQNETFSGEKPNDIFNKEIKVDISFFQISIFFFCINITVLDMLLSKQCQSLNLPQTCTMRICFFFLTSFIKRHQNLNANYLFIWTWFMLQCFLKSIILYRLPMLKVLNVRVDICRFTSILILSWGKHNLKLLNCFLYKQIIIRSEYVPMNMYVFFQMKIVTMLLVVAVFLDFGYTAVWIFFILAIKFLI